MSHTDIDQIAEQAVLAAVDHLSPHTRPAPVIAEASRHVRGAEVREAYWRLRHDDQLVQSPSGELSRRTT